MISAITPAAIGIRSFGQRGRTIGRPAGGLGWPGDRKVMPSPLGHFGHGSAGISAEGRAYGCAGAPVHAPRWQLTGSGQGFRAHPRMIMARSRVAATYARPRAGGCGKWRGPRAENGLRQQDGTALPAFSAWRALTAPRSVLTLTRRIPAGTAPAVSGQLAAGVRKIVAPAARAPAIFCCIPPIGSTVPFASISPVPAMNFPAVRFIGVSLSMMPRANIIPALGPPMFVIFIFTENGKTKLS